METDAYHLLLHENPEAAGSFGEGEDYGYRRSGSGRFRVWPGGRPCRLRLWLCYRRLPILGRPDTLASSLLGNLGISAPMLCLLHSDYCDVVEELPIE